MHVYEAEDAQQTLNDVSIKLRKAKVVIACVTEQYVTSAHCRTEVRARCTLRQ